MNTPVIQDFPYSEDSAEIFEGLLDRDWAAFLDSGYPHSDQGRFDILTADPTKLLLTRGQSTEIHDGTGILRSRDDPFHLLREALGPMTPGIENIPFCGGAVGYFGYDLGRRLERLPSLAKDRERLPEMAVGIYDWALVVDHRERRSWLVGKSRSQIEACRERLLPGSSREGNTRPPSPYRALGVICSNMSRTDYCRSIARIKHYIREGDCYQVNFAQRFSVPATGDSWQLYKRLRRCNAAPFCAYLKSPYSNILSSSPERFLQVRDDGVETRPIKGTCPRGGDAIEDRRLARALRNSRKDRAENLMIVDLLRNDLGKVCATGSIEVPDLFKLESYPNVHHLVSTVTGRLADGQSALSLLRACFPGGSVTGAPKLRAMEIIEELEPDRRGIYCGAIGYIGFNGDMDTSIAIRTMVHSDAMTRLWAGGAIVADSEAETEYAETYHKASAMLKVLERA